MENVSGFISAAFVVTTLLTVAQFYKATNKSRIVFIILAVWIIIQMFIGLSGFYTNSRSVPPRFLLLVLPPGILIVSLFATAKGRAFMDSVNIRQLTFLHSIRILVEIILYFLFMA